MDNEVLALAVSANGDLYAGGQFNMAGGVSASRIAKWNGSAWSALGSGVLGALHLARDQRTGQTVVIRVVADALRYNRTDTALVRVEVPVIEGNDQAATRIAVDFVQAFFTTLRGFLPA